MATISDEGHDVIPDRADAILAELHGPDVLHLGCTGGLMTETPPMEGERWIHGEILRLFPDAWGLDLSSDKIEYLTARGVPNLSIGNAENFSVQKKFDTIVAGELIEHLG